MSTKDWKFLQALFWNEQRKEKCLSLDRIVLKLIKVKKWMLRIVSKKILKLDSLVSNQIFTKIKRKLLNHIN